MGFVDILKFLQEFESLLSRSLGVGGGRLHFLLGGGDFLLGGELGKSGPDVDSHLSLKGGIRLLRNRGKGHQLVNGA